MATCLHLLQPNRCLVARAGRSWEGGKKDAERELPCPGELTPRPLWDLKHQSGLSPTAGHGLDIFLSVQRLRVSSGGHALQKQETVSAVHQCPAPGR